MKHRKKFILVVILLLAVVAFGIMLCVGWNLEAMLP